MILQIKETSLYVSNLDQTKDFYHGKMGFEIIGRAEERHIFFKVGTSVLLCFLSGATKKENSLPSHFASGSIHIAFEINKEEYNKWKEKILKLNIQIIQEQEWKNGLKSFYFRDPDNHLLEIVPRGIWE